MPSVVRVLFSNVFLLFLFSLVCNMRTLVARCRVFFLIITLREKMRKKIHCNHYYLQSIVNFHRSRSLSCTKIREREKKIEIANSLILFWLTYSILLKISIIKIAVTFTIYRIGIALVWQGRFPFAHTEFFIKYNDNESHIKCNTRYGIGRCFFVYLHVHAQQIIINITDVYVRKQNSYSTSRTNHFFSLTRLHWIRRIKKLYKKKCRKIKQGNKLCCCCALQRRCEWWLSW